MRTDEFDYDLPEERIAQSPAVPRDSCKLLVLDPRDERISHKNFTDIVEYLEEGDLLVVNDTKVMPARLLGHKTGSGAAVEVLLLQRALDYESSTAQAHEQYWKALVKPGRRLKPGSTISFEGLSGEVVDWSEADGRGCRIIKLISEPQSEVSDVLQKLGKLPLPPYIKGYAGDTALYQTVYARQQNSAAAPTAGLHFSEALLTRARKKGCSLATVCLEIGLDTFRQVEEEHILDHHIHTEFYSVSKETTEAVQAAKARGGRVIAVGTTAVRALESAASPVSKESSLRIVDREQTSLYITPGYEFKVVDALITNFHTPRSTLLMLVSAFAGYDTMVKAYQEALDNRYRFLSFGDAMLIL